MEAHRETLRKGATGPVPENIPAAMAWLWRIFAAVKALFTAKEKLPELDGFMPAQNPEDEPVRVIAWVSGVQYRRDEIAALWPFRHEVEHARDAIRLHARHLRDMTGGLGQPPQGDRPQILGSVHSPDPKDADFLIVDAATRWPGAALTIMGPGLVLRLNRKARRAARARVRRAFRREMRAEIRQVKENDRRVRQERDRARREMRAALWGPPCHPDD